MRVKMLETRCGTENGFTIRRYVENEEYELADGLARSFLAAGFAVSLPVAGRKSDKTVKHKKTKPSSRARSNKQSKSVLRLIKE